MAYEMKRDWPRLVSALACQVTLILTPQASPQNTFSSVTSFVARVACVLPVTALCSSTSSKFNSYYILNRDFQPTPSRPSPPRPFPCSLSYPHPHFPAPRPSSSSAPCPARRENRINVLQPDITRLRIIPIHQRHKQQIRHHEGQIRLPPQPIDNHRRNYYHCEVLQPVRTHAHRRPARPRMQRHNLRHVYPRHAIRAHSENQHVQEM